MNTSSGISLQWHRAKNKFLGRGEMSTRPFQVQNYVTNNATTSKSWT